MPLTKWYECKACKVSFNGDSDEDQCPECHSERIKLEGSDD